MLKKDLSKSIKIFKSSEAQRAKFNSRGPKASSFDKQRTHQWTILGARWLLLLFSPAEDSHAPQLSASWNTCQIIQIILKLLSNLASNKSSNVHKSNFKWIKDKTIYHWRNVAFPWECLLSAFSMVSVNTTGIRHPNLQTMWIPPSMWKAWEVYCSSDSPALWWSPKLVLQPVTDKM